MDAGKKDLEQSEGDQLNTPKKKDVARRRRQQAKRATARHVNWLIDHFQAKTMHHTLQPTPGAKGQASTHAAAGMLTVLEDMIMKASKILDQLRAEGQQPPQQLGFTSGGNTVEKDKKEEKEKEFQPLTKPMKEALGNNIASVAASSRMADSPCALTKAEHGCPVNVERGHNSMTADMASKKTMETEGDEAEDKDEEEDLEGDEEEDDEDEEESAEDDEMSSEKAEGTTDNHNKQEPGMQQMRSLEFIKKIATSSEAEVMEEYRRAATQKQARASEPHGACDGCGQNSGEGRNGTGKWATKWYCEDCWNCKRRKRWW